MIKLLWPVFLASADNQFKEYREHCLGDTKLLNDNIKITTYHNHGAFLNLGEKNPALVKGLSIGMTAVLSVVFLLTFTHKGRKSLRFGLGLLLGGAFSNTYDRLIRGYVVDYLNFPKMPGFIRNIVFNVSDFAIIIGSMISACS